MITMLGLASASSCGIVSDSTDRRMKALRSPSNDDTPSGARLLSMASSYTRRTSALLSIMRACTPRPNANS